MKRMATFLFLVAALGVWSGLTPTASQAQELPSSTLAVPSDGADVESGPSASLAIRGVLHAPRGPLSQLRDGQTTHQAHFVVGAPGFPARTVAENATSVSLEVLVPLRC